MTVFLTTPAASGRDLEICHSDSETAGLDSTGIKRKKRGSSMCDSWRLQNVHKNTLKFMLGKQLETFVNYFMNSFSEQIVQNCLWTNHCSAHVPSVQ